MVASEISPYLVQTSKTSQAVCDVCNKKIKLSMVRCKCDRNLCRDHVFPGPNGHLCDFDYKSEGRKQLERTLLLIQPEKILKI